PALQQVDEIDDPCDGVEAENGEGEPSPAVTLGEEPGEHCVGDAAGDHRKDAEFEEDAETQAGDDRLNAEEVAPPVRPLVWIAPPAATIDSHPDDNAHNAPA